MILEVATLNVQPTDTLEFEAAFGKAQSIIAGADGYISHQLLRCTQVSNRYLLLVRWRSLDDHVDGFRKSPAYEEWKRLLHYFYDPLPVVEHYELVMGDAPSGTIES